MTELSINHFKRMAVALEALERESENVEAAAEILAEAARRDTLIHVFGVDARAADIQGELFFRPGGLACVNPLYDPAFSNAHGAYRSELCRPLNGLTPKILEYYEYIDSGDPLVLLAFDADSIAFSQAAAWAKEHGLGLVGIIPELPRDKATADLLDAAICFGREHGTLLMTAALDALMARAVELVPGAAAWKGDFFPDMKDCRAVVDKYLWRVRHL